MTNNALSPWTDATFSVGIRSDERGHQPGCYDCGWRGEWRDVREDAEFDAADHRCDDEDNE